jgi:hypothetical protein
MTKYILLSASVIYATYAQAQLELGGKAGLNYHFQSTSLGDNAPSGAEEPNGMDGAGFHVGAFARIGLSDRLHIRPELLYSTRTGSATTKSSLEVPGSTTAQDLRTETSLRYLEVPVLLAYDLSDRLSLHVGPGLGMLLGYKQTVNGTQSVTSNGQTVTTSIDTEDTSTEGLSTTEVAGIIGLGYRTERGLDFGVRYWRGFTALEEDTDLTKTHQNVVQFSVGYALIR